MNCDDFRDHLIEYIDHSLSDSTVLIMDEHRLTCSSCNREVELWEESEQWIKADDIEIDFSKISIASSVMNRIRQEEPWAFSISEKVYSIPKRLFPWVTGIAASLLLLFALSFFTGLSQDAIITNPSITSVASIQEVVGVGEIGYADSNFASNTNLTIDGMVASIGEPLMLRSHSAPDSSAVNLLIVLSLFGFFSILMVMNWISHNLENE